uniref:hypothetical protein n=1 Tax=Acinetobacter baumannii TaxID=470 RepID=UPI001C072B50
ISFSLLKGIDTLFNALNGEKILTMNIAKTKTESKLRVENCGSYRYIREHSLVYGGSHFGGILGKL